MISISVKAPAKLNLFLVVYAKRPDGYHDISTLFERIDLFDKITLKKSKDNRIIVFCDCPEVPRGEKNIVYKAADMLRKKFLIKQGLDISIEKNIPVAAGLGGGSSDAAAVLLALNKLWQLKLGKTDLLQIGASLGADVPFFITGGSLSLSRQPQQEFKPIKTSTKWWHILVVPKVSLSTKRVFERFDRLNKPKLKVSAPGVYRAKLTLTKKGKNVNMLTRLLAKSGRFGDCSLATRAHYNSLEPAANTLSPEISKIKQKLLSLGVESVGMSGSGPSVFAITKSRKEGERLAKNLGRFKNWRTFVVRTF